MNKLKSFALYALITPVITFSATSLLAEEYKDQNMDQKQQSTQREQGAKQDAQNTPRTGQRDSQAAAGRQNASSQNRGFLSSTPANGMQASKLIGAEVKTAADEEVGEVSDLIIGQNGQVAAIIISVGGFMGMGERDVAIGWDDVSQSGVDDDPQVRINTTLSNLRSAPAFENLD